MRTTIINILIFLLLFSTSCNKFMDIVPDNVATIGNAFTMRNTAEKYLFTCYSYLPKTGDHIYDPAMLCADELWHIRAEWASMSIVQGFQNIVNPYFNSWSGLNGGALLFESIRDCNIFLDNISKVPDINELERKRWISEVKFLKAYYHFYLLRMYGPVPLIKTNLPISANVEEVKVYREPVDDCVNYILQLLDEALPDLPVKIEAEATELGRITQVICLSIKAKVLILAASPVFNGNADYANFIDNRQIHLFNSQYDPEKWLKAAEACKAAIDLAHSNGNKLYYYSENDPNAGLVSDRTKVTMGIRSAITAKWNPEIIWSNPNNLSNTTQREAQARLDGSTPGLGSVGSTLSPTLKMVELFYSQNGVPITEDKNWDYENRFEIEMATANDQTYIQNGYQTVALHFNREPRFYADLGFDGSVWYGQGKKTETDNWHVEAKLGQYSGGTNAINGYSATGYWPKKIVNAENVYSANVDYSIVSYPHIEIRLADLYLLYAEALNEYSGPSAEVYSYINLVRKRAGLESVEEAWPQYSTNPTKYTSKEGLREIIQRERAIELAFEGQRYWDLIRWKKAVKELNYRAQGWNILQETPQGYYIPTTLLTRRFQNKDMLWPLQEIDIVTNKNLVQNPGW